jgi:hypothetical protein
MAKVIRLKNTNGFSALLAGESSSSPCDFSKPLIAEDISEQINVPIADLKQKVANYIIPLQNNNNLEDIFMQVAVRRELIQAMLDMNPNAPGFRIYVARDAPDTTVNVNAIYIAVPIDGDRKDVLGDGSVVLECVRPPECPTTDGVELLPDLVKTYLLNFENTTKTVQIRTTEPVV